MGGRRFTGQPETGHLGIALMLLGHGASLGQGDRDGHIPLGLGCRQRTLGCCWCPLSGGLTVMSFPEVYNTSRLQELRRTPHLSKYATRNTGAALGTIGHDGSTMRLA